jgi:hypothetical protein
MHALGRVKAKRLRCYDSTKCSVAVCKRRNDASEHLGLGLGWGLLLTFKGVANDQELQAQSAPPLRSAVGCCTYSWQAAAIAGAQGWAGI